MCTPNQFSLNEAMSLEAQRSLALCWANGNQSSSTQTTVQPRPLDILCGKSKRCVDHGGSRRFRTVIECYREQYQQALTKWDKTSVTRNIYDNLSQAGSRFLKFNEALQQWEEISPMAARDKIGHALRFANRLTRKKRNIKSITTSSEAALPAMSEPSTAIAQPQLQAQPQPLSLQVLGSMPESTNPPSPLQPLHLQQQLPPLSCITTTETPTTVHELLQRLGNARTGVTTAAASHATNQSTTSQPSFVSNQVLQAPGMLTQTFAPLDRSEKWYQSTEAESVNLKVESLKTFRSNPAPPAVTSLLDDSSLSLLDDIFPLNQSPQEPPPISASSSQDLPDEDLPFDFDFDAEILSVLL